LRIRGREGGASPRPLGVSSRLALALSLGWALSIVPAAASGHEGSARLILEPDRVNPGGVVVVRGEDLGADNELSVALVGTAGRAPLTSVTSDGEGHFSVPVLIPADAPVGVYAIEAGAGLNAVLFIEGAPIAAGDGGPPGRDEPLLVVLPPDWQRSLASPIASLRPFVTPPDEAAPAPVPADDVDVVPVVALVGAIAALAILGWRTRRPRAGPVDSAELP
jgi:hypothetical protein